MLFDKACEAIGLDATFKPYSLRRRGAPTHFQRHANLGLTMEIGRWSDSRTARLYVNRGLLQLSSMTALNSDAIEVASSHFIQFIIGPALAKDVT